MTKTLGLIGSGMIGGGLARLAVAAGLDVVLSNSRGPRTLAGLVAELGGHARAATPEEAARAGDLVVATVPLKAYDRLPAAALAGKVVIDTMNYYPDRDGRIAELDAGGPTSSALVQRHLADSRVVKAFNSIDFRRLFVSARPSGAPDRSALPSPVTTRPPRRGWRSCWTSSGTTRWTSARSPTAGAVSRAPRSPRCGPAPRSRPTAAGRLPRSFRSWPRRSGPDLGRR